MQQFNISIQSHDAQFTEAAIALTEWETKLKTRKYLTSLAIEAERLTAVLSMAAKVNGSHKKLLSFLQLLILSVNSIWNQIFQLQCYCYEQSQQKTDRRKPWKAIPRLILCRYIGNRLGGLVVRVPGYRSGGPGSFPGASRFSEKYWVWNGVHPAS
jgi:hypothetical protein